MQDVIGLVAQWWSQASRVVALTGAGISTDSGIPDYRGPNGLWTTRGVPTTPADPEAWLVDEELRKRSWASRIDAPLWRAHPNAGHRALADAQRAGALSVIVTQNTDGLHLLAGRDPSGVVELHGSTRRTACVRCGATCPTREVLERVRAGEDDPRCLEERDGRRCGGVLRVGLVGFNQPIEKADLARALEAARSAELLLAVGSTLRVDPAATLVPIASAAGARVVVVNDSPTRHDALADLVIRAPISEVLPAVVSSALGVRAREGD